MHFLPQLTWRKRTSSWQQTPHPICLLCPVPGRLAGFRVCRMNTWMNSCLKLHHEITVPQQGKTPKVSQCIYLYKAEYSLHWHSRSPAQGSPRLTMDAPGPVLTLRAQNQCNLSSSWQPWIAPRILNFSFNLDYNPRGLDGAAINLQEAEESQEDPRTAWQSDSSGYQHQPPGCLLCPPLCRLARLPKGPYSSGIGGASGLLVSENDICGPQERDLQPVQSHRDPGLERDLHVGFNTLWSLSW